MTTTIKPMFPPTIDSTILSTFRACPHKFFRQYVEHWKGKAQNVHLIAGGAFASGIEAARHAFYVDVASPQDAEAIGITALIQHYGDFEPPADSAKTLERMIGALEFYFSHYPLGADGATPVTMPSGRLGIEFSFAEPLPVTHPVTGDPILYTGRSDMIAHRLGGIYAYDEKTAPSLGASWAKQWEMRSQFTGYIWAAEQQGLKLNGAIVRGVSILKTKYDTLEVPTNRGDYEVSRWLDQTCRDIERMKKMWEEGYWDFSLDGACTEYGGCPFVHVCKSPTPENWLPVNFVQRVWDPLAREEITVEEYEAQWGYTRDPSQAPASNKLHAAPAVSADMQAELATMLRGTNQ